jgi:hypothetical protein
LLFDRGGQFLTGRRAQDYTPRFSQLLTATAFSPSTWARLRRECFLQWNRAQAMRQRPRRRVLT